MVNDMSHDRKDTTLHKMDSGHMYTKVMQDNRYKYRAEPDYSPTLFTSIVTYMGGILFAVIDHIRSSGDLK